MKKKNDLPTLQELSPCEAMNTDGGVIAWIAAAFLTGRRVEYMKNGGGFFDFYL